MKRRQFLGIACASTVFVNACKKDEPKPATTVQGTITDTAGKPVVGLEVEYLGSGGGGNPSQIGGFGSPSPFVTFSEKSWTNDKGFFQIFKVIPGGIDPNSSYLLLPVAVYQKYTMVEAKKDGIIVSDLHDGPSVVASGSDITPGTVNEYLITLK